MPKSAPSQVQAPPVPATTPSTGIVPNPPLTPAELARLDLLPWPAAPGLERRDDVFAVTPSGIRLHGNRAAARANVIGLLRELERERLGICPQTYIELARPKAVAAGD